MFLAISLSNIAEPSLKNISLILVGFLFSFKLKIIPNYCSRCVSIRFLERINSYPIYFVLFSESECSNPSPQWKSCQKNPFQWKQRAYPISKLEQSNSDPVWWKHRIKVKGMNENIFVEALVIPTISNHFSNRISVSVKLLWRIFVCENSSNSKRRSIFSIIDIYKIHK